MEVIAGFKRTEVGLIPEDWEVTEVGAEFSIQLGKMLDSQKNVGVPKPFLGNRAVQWGRIDVVDLGVVKLTPSDLLRFRLRAGDLLVCEGGEVGRCAVWREPIEECYYQKALHRLRPRREYSVTLMHYVLLRLASNGSLLSFVTQTSIAHLPKDKLETVPIPLPPTKAEQEAITEALSDADTLIESLEQLLTKKRHIKYGAMQELLTGKKRLLGFGGEWVSKPLGEVAEIVMGQSPSSRHYNNRGEGLPLIQGNADIRNRRTIKRVFTAEITKRGRCGDILMSVRAPVGGISRALFDVCLGRGVCAIRHANDFLYHALIAKEPAWARLSRGSTFDSVNSTDVKGFGIEMPRSEDEQTAIAAVLSDMDDGIAALEAKLTKARNLKQGMMQELLTGRIRLV
ncbi:MAG: restriction endonuclease subunit S [Candidatus Eisenbacteria bacterium]